MFEMIIGYVALLEQVGEGQYIVEFPDLPGCFSQGDSLEEAICRAQEALAIYYLEKQRKLPKATDFKSIQCMNPDKIVQMITFSINRPIRAVKKTLTIPEWLNTLAEKYQVNFSHILKYALINYLKKLGSLSPCDKIMLDSYVIPSNQ